jgi:hypothetical protein
MSNVKNLNLSSIQNIQENNILEENKNNFEEEIIIENKNIIDEVQEEQPMTASDIIYKNKIMAKIKQYKETFQELLIQVNIDSLEEKNINELETLLLMIKEIVANRNMKKNIQQVINTIPIGIEYIATSFTPLKLNGYSDLLIKDPEFYYNCQEIILEYDLFDNINTRPEYRLGYQMVLSALLCHKINCIKESQINLNKPISEDVKNKYSNL